MHQFGGSNALARSAEHTVTYTTDGSVLAATSTVVATPPSGGGVVNMTSLGSHFLTHPDVGGDIVETIGKMETLPPIEVVVKKKDCTENEKKVCLWPTGNGVTCGKTFTKFDSLKRHLAEAHKGVRPFACTLCDKSYGRRDYLQRHFKSHNSNFAVNLSSSSPSTVQLETVVSHHVSHHHHHHVSHHQQSQQNQLITHSHQQQHQLQNVVKVEQQQQQQQQNTQLQLTHHQQHSPPTTNILVQIQRSNSPPLPSSHLEVSSLVVPNNQSITTVASGTHFQLTGESLPSKSGGGGSKICRWVQNDGTVCGKAFSKLDSLRRHVTELHKGVRPYACNLCDKNYGRRDYLERHMRTHDANHMNKRKTGPIDWGPNSGVLSGGGMTSSSVDSLPRVLPKKKRKDIPAEEKKICLWVLEDGTACGKTFTKFDSLKRHVSEAHKGIRPYACTLCGKNYGRRDYLLRHLKSHNEQQQQQDGENSPRTSHMVTPTTINFTPSPPSPLIRTSSTPSTTITHIPQLMSTVTSSSSSSTSPPTLIVSKKRLDDKKTCRWVLGNGTVCGRSFSKFDSLRRHVQELHKGIRPFVCTLCEKSYGRRDYLQRHMKSHESDSPPPSSSSSSSHHHHHHLGGSIVVAQ